MGHFANVSMFALDKRNTMKRGEILARLTNAREECLE